MSAEPRRRFEGEVAFMTERARTIGFAAARAFAAGAVSVVVIQLASDPYGQFSSGRLLKARRLVAEDNAEAVVWLASEESRSLIGAAFNVVAGWTARG